MGSVENKVKSPENFANEPPDAAASIVKDWAKAQALRALEDNWEPVYRIPASSGPIPKILQALAEHPGFPGVKQIPAEKGGGIAIRFNTIEDEEILQTLSQVAEDHYLSEIAKHREAFISRILLEQNVTRQTAITIFERYLCKTELYFLSKFVLGYDKEVFHLHYFMAKSMESITEGYRGLREFPRDSFKSTIMTISYMVQQALKNPNVRILLKSNNTKNACKKMVEVKNHFIRNKQLIDLFPEYYSDRVKDQGSNSYWAAPCRTIMQEEGTFEADGVGGSRISQHYDQIIGDDFWDQKSVKSAELTTKVKAEMNQLEYLLVSPAKGIIFFIGTRFAHDDPTKTLSEIDIKTGKTKSGYHCIIVSGITKLGRSLFPESLTLQKYYNQANQSTYEFSCQIMLNPSTEDMQFKSSWFRTMSWRELRRRELDGKLAVWKVILFDAAGTDKKTSDHVAVGVVAIDNLGRKTLIEYYREKLSPAGLLNLLYDLVDKHQNHLHLTAGQKAPLEVALQSFINEKNRERRENKKSRLDIYEVSLGKEGKISRMAALQPYFQGGSIFFDDEEIPLESLKALKDSILAFPNNSSEDDGMDMLSMLTDPVVSSKPPFKATVSPADTVVENSDLSEKDKVELSARLQRQELTKQAYARQEKTGRSSRRSRYNHKRRRSHSWLKAS